MIHVLVLLTDQGTDSLLGCYQPGRIGLLNSYTYENASLSVLVIPQRTIGHVV